MRNQPRNPRRSTLLPQPSRRQAALFPFGALFHRDEPGPLPSARGNHCALSLPIPRDTADYATQLLNQQFWCWGQDIARPRDNALVEHGFSRHRPRTTRKGQISHYVLSELSGPKITPLLMRKIGLWGSGLFYGDRRFGAMYLKRNTLAPIVLDFACPIEQIDGPDEIPAPDGATASVDEVLQMLGDLCQWLSQYETWVQSRLGIDYREACVRDWKKSVATAAEMVSAWRRLASVFHQGMTTGDDPVANPRETVRPLSSRQRVRH